MGTTSSDRAPLATFAALLLGAFGCFVAAVATGADAILGISGIFLVAGGLLCLRNWRGTADRWATWWSRRMPSPLPEPQFTRLLALGVVVIGCVWIVWAFARLSS